MMSKKKAAIWISLVIIMLLIGWLNFKTPSNPVWLESGTEDNTSFLSDEYFIGLNDLFEKVRDDHKKWYIVDGSSEIAARAVIVKMMQDLESNPGALTNHENSVRYFETFDRNIRKAGSITEEVHFFRNTLNSYSGAPVSLDDMITLAAEGKWKLFSAKYHRYNHEGVKGALNLKFISKDGRFEAVYNSETGEMVTDPFNMGTYNYAPGSINPLKYYKHYTFDKQPWKKWGNESGVSFEDIMSLESGHGSSEEKNNSKEIKRWIKQRKEELKLE